MFLDSRETRGTFEPFADAHDLLTTALSEKSINCALAAPSAGPGTHGGGGRPTPTSLPPGSVPPFWYPKAPLAVYIYTRVYLLLFCANH